MNKFEAFDKDLSDNNLFDINFQQFVSLYAQYESQNPEYKKNLFYHCLDNEFIQHIKNNLSERLDIKFYHNHNEVAISNCHEEGHGAYFSIEDKIDNTCIKFSSNNKHKSIYIELKIEHKISEDVDINDYTPQTSEKKIRLNREDNNDLFSYSSSYSIYNFDGFCLFRYDYSQLFDKKNNDIEIYTESRGKNNIFDDLEQACKISPFLSNEVFDLIGLKYDSFFESSLICLKNNFQKNDIRELNKQCIAELKKIKNTEKKLSKKIN